MGKKKPLPSVEKQEPMEGAHNTTTNVATQSLVKPPRANTVAVSVHHEHFTHSLVYGIRNLAELVCNGLFIKSAVLMPESVTIGRKLTLEIHGFF